MAMTTTTAWGRMFGIGPVEVLTNYNPGSTPTTYNLDLSAYVPAGTKAVQLSMQGTASNDWKVAFRKTGNSVDSVKGYQANTGGVGNCSGWVELDSSYTCDLYFENSDIAEIYVNLSAGAIP